MEPVRSVTDCYLGGKNRGGGTRGRGSLGTGPRADSCGTEAEYETAPSLGLLFGKW